MLEILSSTSRVTPWGTFRTYVYNSEDKTCCSRTIWNWLALITFIITFTLFIGGTFFVFFYLIQHLVSKYYPKSPWQTMNDILDKPYPAMTFLPNLNMISTHLLWYTFKGNQSRYNMKPQAYINYLTKYLKAYEKAEKQSLRSNSPYINCSFDTIRPENKVCIFRKSTLRHCGEPGYGYKEKKPCVLLKINKQLDWKPVGYDLSNLPAEMPESLKEMARKIGIKDYIWVSCKGRQPMDSEHLGKVLYYPQQGFPGYYFPYNGEKHYISPLVAVQLEDIATGIVVNIECQLWAKNIELTSSDSHNRIILTIYIDK